MKIRIFVTTSILCFLLLLLPPIQADDQSGWTFSLLSNQSTTIWDQASVAFQLHGTAFNLTVVANTNVLINWSDGGTSFIPAASNESSGVTQFTNALPFFMPIKFNVSSLDAANATLRTDAFPQDECDTNMYIIVGTSNTTLAEDVLSISCEFGTNGTKSIRSTASQILSNSYACPYTAAEKLPAGLEVDLRVALTFQPSTNFNTTSFNASNTVALTAASYWTSARNPNALVCGTTDVQVKGSFFTDRYYSCEFCYNSLSADNRSNNAVNSTWMLPENATYLNCSVEVPLPPLNDSSRKQHQDVLYVCAVYESMSQSESVSLSSSSSSASSSADSAVACDHSPCEIALGSYGCTPQKHNWWKENLLYGILIIAGVVGAIVVVAAVGVILRRRSDARRGERTPLRQRTNQDA